MLKHLFCARPKMQDAMSRLTRHGVAVDVCDRFAAFLLEAPARELYHFNPRLLTERLPLDERAILKLLLTALSEGIVTLHWDIRCPRCGAMDHHRTSLSQLHHECQCPVCQVSSPPRLDEEVRVTFSPHPRLRALPASADDAVFRSQIDTRLGPVPGQSLLLLPDFQRLFPQEHLAPDESLEVTRVVVLFTDLAGSTALYAARGDPRAYHLVRLHFDALLQAADSNGGTIVKTIGDAIMAAFQTPVEAMRGALAMQHHIAALNEREHLSNSRSLLLKVGLHAGPCLNVTLNDRPDYFGTTVNIAARVQGVSHGGDVVCTDILYTDPEVQTLVQGYTVESTPVMLKGIIAPVLVHRLWMLDVERPAPD